MKDQPVQQARAHVAIDGKDPNVEVHGLSRAPTWHQWDPNLSQEKIDEIHETQISEDQEKAVEVEKELAQDSQYETVRAAVRNTDGGEPANTVRAWILGMIFCTIGSGLNMFLSMR